MHRFGIKSRGLYVRFTVSQPDPHSQRCFTQVEPRVRVKHKRSIKHTTPGRVLSVHQPRAAGRRSAVLDHAQTLRQYCQQIADALFGVQPVRFGRLQNSEYDRACPCPVGCIVSLNSQFFRPTTFGLIVQLAPRRRFLHQSRERLFLIPLLSSLPAASGTRAGSWRCAHSLSFSIQKKRVSQTKM